MRTQWRLGIIALTFTLLGALPACTRGGGVEAAGDDSASAVSAAEREFMVKSAQTNIAEIDMARWALKNSSNRDVRDFANMIQSDATRSLEDLSDLMNDKNVRRPEAPAADIRQDISRMGGLGGPEFDREFINMMVAEIQQAAGMFRDQAAESTDGDVQKFAEDSLPQLEMHLEKARRLQSKLFNERRRSP
jgi:putative membrane protein